VLAIAGVVFALPTLAGGSAPAPREGDLFRWNVSGSSALNNSWWHYRHDEWNTGQYGLDSRPPATVTGLRAKRRRSGEVLVRFLAPGDDWMIGRAASYDIRYSHSTITPGSFASATPVTGVPAPDPGGTSEEMRLSVPSDASYLAVRAIDPAGNLGAEVTVQIR
jgi:hypothetical protein